MEQKMEKLECLFCRKRYPLDVFSSFCPSCAEPLLLFYPTKKRYFYLDRVLALERFKDFLPLSQINPKLSLGEGNTPLLLLDRLMKKFNFPSIFAKNEISNPTGSFKDRGTIVAVQKAKALGMNKIGTVSTGNMAGSTAAYAAKASLKSFIFVKEGTPQEKILSTGIYNPFLVKVRGDYGQLFFESLSLGKKFGIYFMNSVDPFRIEGYKVTGFEIFVQLGHKPPDYIFVPLSSGGHLIGLMRAFLDLKKEGLIHNFPRFVGVQAKGCSPLARAYERGKSRFKKFINPQTIAHAISNPNPPGGNIVLKMIRENNGLILSVSDRELLKSQKILAEYEGIFCDPASATTLAGLIKLSKILTFQKQDKIILIITGSGLKTMSDLESSSMNIIKTSIPNLEETIKDVLF